MSDLSEIKKLIEDQGSSWEQFKQANDARLKAIEAKGYAPADLTEKVEKLSASLDDVAAQKDAIEAKLNRISMGGGEDQKEMAAEVKTFNLLLQADAKQKGKTLPAEVTLEGYAQYKSGFFKIMRNERLLSADEQKAMQAGSDPDGGYMLPASTVGKVVQKVYEQSIMRRLATIQPITGLSLEGMIDNDEASAGWVSELGTRSDSSTPQVGKYRIEAFEMYAMPKVSQTLIDDAAVDVEGWLADKVAEKFARVESAAFWTGTGVGQPFGLASYATAATADATRAWGTFEHVKTGANGDFYTTKADPLQDLIGAFKDQYLQNAQFVMRRAVRTKIRKLKEATSDRYLWEPSLQQGAPDRLLGYPASVDEYMPTLGTGSNSLALGDFKAAYTILDRVGIRTLRDPYTAKPYIVFYSTRRVGGGAVNFEAVKFLNFAS